MTGNRLNGIVRSIIILPGTVLVFVPGLLLYLSRNSSCAGRITRPSEIQFWIGLACLGIGLSLIISTVRLQLSLGEGTPAPWDPPRKLVIRGPYRYLRNPMISGVFLILLAEALLLNSWPILIWFSLFILFNLIYIPLVEEKELESRFGPPYHLYKEGVPRWIPRLAPWTPASTSDEVAESDA